MPNGGYSFIYGGDGGEKGKTNSSYDWIMNAFTPNTIIEDPKTHKLKVESTVTYPQTMSFFGEVGLVDLAAPIALGYAAYDSLKSAPREAHFNFENYITPEDRMIRNKRYELEEDRKKYGKTRENTKTIPAKDYKFSIDRKTKQKPKNGGSDEPTKSDSNWDYNWRW